MNKKTNKKIMLWIPMVIAPIATISTVVSCSIGTDAKLTAAAEKLKNEMKGFKIKLVADKLRDFKKIIELYNELNKVDINDGSDSKLLKQKRHQNLTLLYFNNYSDNPKAKEMNDLNAKDGNLIKSIFDKLKTKFLEINKAKKLGLEKHFESFSIDLNGSGDKYALTIYWKDGITMSDGITITISE